MVVPTSTFLRRQIAAEVYQPLDRERPLWEMHLFEGLAGGRSALLQKVHHSMIEGMAGAPVVRIAPIDALRKEG